VWKITSYYTPLPDQNEYYYNSYMEDFRINCSGDCSITASGTTVDDNTLACPPNFAFGTNLYIDGLGIKTCRDRGGAITGKRLDAWSGFGDEGRERIQDPDRTYSGMREVWLVE